MFCVAEACAFLVDGHVTGGAAVTAARRSLDAARGRLRDPELAERMGYLAAGIGAAREAGGTSPRAAARGTNLYSRGHDEDECVVGSRPERNRYLAEGPAALEGPGRGRAAALCLTGSLRAALLDPQRLFVAPLQSVVLRRLRGAGYSVDVFAVTSAALRDLRLRELLCVDEAARTPAEARWLRSGPRTGWRREAFLGQLRKVRACADLAAGGDYQLLARGRLDALWHRFPEDVASLEAPGVVWLPWRATEGLTQYVNDCFAVGRPEEMAPYLQVYDALLNPRLWPVHRAFEDTPDGLDTEELWEVSLLASNVLARQHRGICFNLLSKDPHATRAGGHAEGEDNCQTLPLDVHPHGYFSGAEWRRAPLKFLPGHFEHNALLTARLLHLLLAEWARLGRPAKVLDFGCGRATMLERWLQSYPASLAGVDMLPGLREVLGDDLLRLDLAQPAFPAPRGRPRGCRAEPPPGAGGAAEVQPELLRRCCLDRACRGISPALGEMDDVQLRPRNLSAPGVLPWGDGRADWVLAVDVVASVPPARRGIFFENVARFAAEGAVFVGDRGGEPSVSTPRHPLESLGFLRDRLAERWLAPFAAQWSVGRCVFGLSYGCVDGAHVWVSDGCDGWFRRGGAPEAACLSDAGPGARRSRWSYEPEQWQYVECFLPESAEYSTGPLAAHSLQSCGSRRDAQAKETQQNRASLSERDGGAASSTALGAEDPVQTRLETLRGTLRSPGCQALERKGDKQSSVIRWSVMVVKCPACEQPFRDDWALGRHMGTAACRRNRAVRRRPAGARGLAGQGNARRGARRSLRRFVAYLKDTLKRQRRGAQGLRTTRLVPYSPLLDPRSSQVKAGDLHGAARELLEANRKLRSSASAKHLRVRLLAGVLATCSAWAPRFAKLVGPPPVPTTEAFKQRVRREVTKAARSRRQLFNVGIQATLGFTMTSFRGPALQLRVDEFVDVACERADRAADGAAAADLNSLLDAVAGPFLPRDGCMISLSTWLRAAVGEAPESDIDALAGAPMASGAAAGAATLAGDSAEELERSGALVMARAPVLVEEMDALWPRGGREGRPPIGPARLCVQLCQWKRRGFGTSCKANSFLAMFQSLQGDPRSCARASISSTSTSAQAMTSALLVSSSSAESPVSFAAPAAVPEATGAPVRASMSLSDASPTAAHNHVNKELRYPSRGRRGPATAPGDDFRPPSLAQRFHAEHIARAPAIMRARKWPADALAIPTAEAPLVPLRLFCDAHVQLTEEEAGASWAAGANVRAGECLAFNAWPAHGRPVRVVVRELDRDGQGAEAAREGGHPRARPGAAAVWAEAVARRLVDAEEGLAAVYDRNDPGSAWGNGSRIWRAVAWGPDPGDHGPEASRTPGAAAAALGRLDAFAVLLQTVRLLAEVLVSAPALPGFGRAPAGIMEAAAAALHSLRRAAPAGGAKSSSGTDFRRRAPLARGGAASAGPAGPRQSPTGCLRVAACSSGQSGGCWASVSSGPQGSTA
ncbi:unnamed protein product [Prorocentrum cordatum]|uniref:Uncharacterized protein n=1 Tax=Prorocentrum cordatum TaxID=2364126 RepID=A0ABN9QQY2_9DINO|nr:unnamed protein product [Polarella glacialis]